jgi:hypothetical protein
VQLFDLPNRGVGVVFRRRGVVTLVAAGAGCALLAACSPSPPAATPTPSITSASPSATPTESAIERQMRLDYEAAEKAYRANIAEQDRQSQLGIAEATPALTSTASGFYLKAVLDGLRSIRNSGWKAVGVTDILGVSRSGWKVDDIRFVSCEDLSRIRFIDKSGKEVKPKGTTLKYLQDLRVHRFKRTWKVIDLESKQVKTFDGVPCGS